MGGEVGTLLIRVQVLGNEAYENRNGFLYIQNIVRISQISNLADRWKQHIKRGIGAEAPTHNKLYPAMMEFGVENFTFEVIEECGRDKLNDREDYYQEFFKAKEFGYSIK